MRKEDEVGGEQRRERSFVIGSTVIEGNFGYYIKTNIPTIYILLCINKPIEMNIFVDIILAIIKKNFLFFKPFKRIREKFGSLAELNHKYKGQKTGTSV